MIEDFAFHLVKLFCLVNSKSASIVEEVEVCCFRYLDLLLLFLRSLPLLCLGDTEKERDSADFIAAAVLYL